MNTTPDRRADFIEWQWATAFPHPSERARWRAHFRDADAQQAATYRQHFTDPHAARRWYAFRYPPHLAAYLTNHGIDPDTARAATRTGIRERTGTLLDTEGTYRAAIIAAHPHLTREERDTLVTLTLDLTELDHLIATGTYDHDALKVLAALT